MASRRSCSSRECSGRQKTNISTLSNWWTRNMPRVSFPAEAGRIARVAERQLVRGKLLLHVHGGERHLRGSGQVEFVALDSVEVDLVRRQEAGSVHRLLEDEDRRQYRRKALADEPVEGEPVQGELRQRRLP